MIPAKYQWLEKEPGPKMLLEAIKLYGIRETLGEADNPIILEWASELGLKDYIHDSIAWCGLFMAIVASRAGKIAPDHPLWAANWLKFGHVVPVAMLGDVLVFKRPGGNHVGLYVAEDSICYDVFGGNQGDQVSIVRILKGRCIGIRRPDYHVQPANVRRIIFGDDGFISANEN